MRNMFSREEYIEELKTENTNLSPFSNSNANNEYFCMPIYYHIVSNGTKKIGRAIVAFNDSENFDDCQFIDFEAENAKIGVKYSDVKMTKEKSEKDDLTILKNLHNFLINSHNMREVCNARPTFLKMCKNYLLDYSNFL